jgi:hypothetical protein
MDVCWNVTSLQTANLTVHILHAGSDSFADFNLEVGQDVLYLDPGATGFAQAEMLTGCCQSDPFQAGCAGRRPTLH